MVKIILIVCGFLCLQVAAEVNLSDKLLRENSQENVIFSPFAAGVGLSMILMGAGGKTAEQLQTALNFGDVNRLEIAAHYKALLQSLKSKREMDPKINVASGIFVSDRFRLNPAFNEISRNYFGAEAQSISFHTPQNAAKTINSWVASRTDNIIRNIVSPIQIKSTTEMSILNAVHFSGYWASPFDPDETQLGDFYMTKTNKVPVEMMNQIAGFNFADLANLKATGVQMRYLNSPISMWIFMPNEIDKFGQMESQLIASEWNKITAQFSTRQVNLTLPKFKFDFDVDMVPHLKEAIHKAIINVNEEGTVAAAANDNSGGVLWRDLQQFDVNRPFYFVIRSDQTILFEGHVVKF
ncbi:serine protease inhibitor 42Dd-like [Scaptodrosophila lebanonensis]|uniref:Serine protease inhibitor 42Dd-like n=1 Tax=Drosophila lebanonensis TaxID=7225 RepID=A0A6J2TFU5_DROLE|nr:serine protease inhibitor 42Dd-like [Scaptodrosophila lebanonensis]